MKKNHFYAIELHHVDDDDYYYVRKHYVLNVCIIEKNSFYFYYFFFSFSMIQCCYRNKLLEIGFPTTLGVKYN